MFSSRDAVTRIAVRTGYPVKAAWAYRTHGAMGTVAGVMRHHTGTPVRAGMDDYPTLRIIREGRPDLSGPLATWGLGRSGTIYLISAGICWHAGGGTWGGVGDGNGHFWGIEAESDGRVWTVEQLDAYPRLVASALHELGRGAEWAPRHAQWATPKGRKVDTSGLDEAAFDRTVAGYLAAPATINRHNAAAGGPPPAGKDDDMDPGDRADLKAARAAAESAYNAANRAASGVAQMLNRGADLYAFRADDAPDVFVLIGAARLRVQDQPDLGHLGLAPGDVHVLPTGHHLFDLPLVGAGAQA